jgi:hypothetical protein
MGCVYYKVKMMMMIVVVVLSLSATALKCVVSFKVAVYNM